MAAGKQMLPREPRVYGDTAVIPLTRGNMALVDAIDADLGMKPWATTRGGGSGMARIGKGYLGLFATKEEAGVAYAEAARKMYGEFARSE